MFIGHLPAGYLITKGLLRRSGGNGSVAQTGPLLLALGLSASLLPDLDMFYFYLIDHGQHLHHGYWTHLPIFWLVVCIGLFALFSVIQVPDQMNMGIMVILAAGLLHQPACGPALLLLVSPR